MKAFQAGFIVCLSLLLCLIPFTCYIQLVSTRYSVYIHLTRNSGLFFSDHEAQEAAKILYKGLIQHKKLEFPFKQVTLSTDEQTHMLDVSQLLHLNLIGCIISLFLFMFSLVICFRLRKWQLLYFASIGACCLFFAILLIGLFQFDALFFFFHRMLFQNDLWLLPADSALLKLFPTRFFFQHFIGIFSLSLLWFIILIISSVKLIKGSKE